MKRFALSLLAAAVAFGALAEPALAGRRARRAAVATGAATAGVAAGAAVASTRRTTVVAAPVVVASSRTTVTAAALPDLTVSEFAMHDECQCTTVANVGRAAAPSSVLKREFHALADRALVAATSLRVPPLAVNQSLRFRLHALPEGLLEATAIVDPANRIAESDERNNDLAVELQTPTPAEASAALPDVDVQIAPVPELAEPIAAGVTK